jgi:hypothetical protein
MCAAMSSVRADRRDNFPRLSFLPRLGSEIGLLSAELRLFGDLAYRSTQQISLNREGHWKDPTRSVAPRPFYKAASGTQL